MKKELVTCLWFDYQAEEAAKFYVSLFDGAGIDSINYYGEEGFQIHGRKRGTVQRVNFHMLDRSFLALNGGPLFTFNESISFQIFCDTQQEIDFYWEKLIEEGQEGQCGWLKDRFGLSWQVIPLELMNLLSNTSTVGKVTEAFLKMKKFDIEALKRACK